MFWAIICLNLILSLGLAWYAWRCWGWRRAILRATQRLEFWTNLLNSKIPQLKQSFYNFHKKIYSIRKKYQTLFVFKQRFNDVWSFLISLTKKWKK